MYDLIRTDSFDEQLREIIFRIADNYGNEKALKILGEIENSIADLSSFPKSGVDPKYNVLKRNGFKVLILKKNLVFYKINEEEHRVIIEAITDFRRDYARIVLGRSDYSPE